MSRDTVSRTGLWTEAGDSIVRQKPSERTQIWSDTCHKHSASPQHRDGLAINATRAFAPQCNLGPLAQCVLYRSVINAWPIDRARRVSICGSRLRNGLMKSRVWGDRNPTLSLFTCRFYKKLLNTDGCGMRASGEIRRGAITSNLIRSFEYSTMHISFTVSLQLMWPKWERKAHLLASNARFTAE